METPYEIKKVLECCYGNKERRLCEKCPNACKIEGYSELICTNFDSAGENALAYIQQLERERDAAVEELKVYKFCTACKHDKDNLDANESSPCFGCSSKSNWQWRGPQEVN